MKPLTKFIARTLSVRLSLMVVLAIASLLTAALFVMFRYSRKAVKEEALLKADVTLEATVQKIDNVLLSVEQSMGNIYWTLLEQVNNPERMYVLSRKVVETNPNIAGCSIAFEPNYFKDRGEYFMAYYRRDAVNGRVVDNASISRSETFGNEPYYKHPWYTIPLASGRAAWLNPIKSTDPKCVPITTFSLPIYSSEGKVVGVMAAHVTLELLSNIVLSAKPSPNSYSTLLSSDGSYLVHPDSTKLFHQTVFNQTDPTVKEVAQAMVSGQSGYKYFRLNGKDCYVFYKPFTRSAVPGRTTEDLKWSVGIIYPDDDIFGDYYRLHYLVISIAVIGLLLLLVLTQLITHRQLLPLRLLTESAQRIANGHYDELIPDSRQQDEVGRLQDHFKQMQLSLSAHMGKLKQLNTTLVERGDMLSKSYEQAKEADRMKTAFLHNMTNQMNVSMTAISEEVNTLCANYGNKGQEKTNRIVNDIQKHGKMITELLNDMLSDSDKQPQPSPSENNNKPK